jgi:hypothetical protein
MIKKFLSILKGKKEEKPVEYILEFKTKEERDATIRDLCFEMAFSNKKQEIEIISPTKIKVVKYKK